MRLILLDQNAPLGLRNRLPGFDIRSAYSMGWHELANGRLLAAAEESGFDVMVTGDQNITYQQNLKGQKLAIVVLGTNHWPTIAAHLHLVRDALAEVEPGVCRTVSFPRPVLICHAFGPDDFRR